MDTRQQILEKNFEAIRLNGFQGCRADKVIQSLGITKGALYHYFPTKFDLGYAIVDEIIAPRYVGLWEQVAASEANPIDQLQGLLDLLLEKQGQSDIEMGCVLNNLIQEMSPLDEGFRNRLSMIVSKMQAAVAKALKKGQEKGWVRKNLNTENAALFIIAAFEGCFGMAKTTKSKAQLGDCLNELKNYLDTLRA